jgi:hypothetical protein
VRVLDLDGVRAYIDNQEEHHRKRSYSEEVEELMRKHGFARMSAGDAQKRRG